MDLLSAEWFCEMDDAALMDEWQVMNTLGNFGFVSPTMPFSSTAKYSSSPFPPLASTKALQTAGSIIGKPAAADTLNPVQNNKPSSSSSASSIISFANSNLPSEPIPNSNLRTSVKTEMVFTSRSCVEDDQKDVIGFGRQATIKKGCTRSAVQAQDHVLAERKRRERLTQSFIALSSLVPGLKKLDKASVLGDAMKYIKDLQERVKTLEEKAKRHADESPAAVKRVRLSGCNDGYSSDNTSDASTERSLPEIEVRSSDRNMLVRVYCKRHSGVIKEIFSEIEKMQLSILSSSVMPFGKTATHITIIAQMDHKFCKAEKDVANNIRMTILKFIRCGELSSHF